MTKVFIDGSAGTAGLRIHSRLENRADLELITLTGEARKDPAARKAALNSCDLAVLCLPDAASREAVAMIENPAVRVVDTSTAHRVAPGWAYGFPELSAARREAIVSGARVASPGCHAGGFIVLVQPLIEAGLLNGALNIHLNGKRCRFGCRKGRGKKLAVHSYPHKNGQDQQCQQNTGSLHGPPLTVILSIS